MSDTMQVEVETSGRCDKPVHVVVAEADLACVLHRISERGGEELSHVSELMFASNNQWVIGEDPFNSDEAPEWRSNLRLSYSRDLPLDLKMHGRLSTLFSSVIAEFRLFEDFPALISLHVKWSVDGKVRVLDLFRRDLLLLLAYPDSAVVPAILARCYRRHGDEVKTA